jgi:CheY-like chemotaxis protein
MIADKKRIICIEDEPETTNLMKLILAREGYEVLGANGGEEGLALVNEQIPDLILLDLMMPEMDGFEFMEALRRRGEHGRIPVIVITAKDLTEEDHRRLNGGVERIIQKGATSPAEVLELVRTLLAGKIDYEV